MRVGDGFPLLRRDRAHPFVENIAQQRLAPDHANPQLVGQLGNLPGDFQVEQAFLLDRIGRNDQRTNRHVRLPPRNQLDRLRLALRVDDAQAGIVAAKAFSDHRPLRQSHRFVRQALWVADVRMLFARDDDVLIEKHRLGEQQPLIAGRRLIEEAHDLAAPRLRRRQRLFPGLHRQEFDGQANALRNQADQIGRDAFMPPLFVDALERHPVGIDAHRHRTHPLQIILLGTGKRDTRRGRLGRHRRAAMRRNQKEQKRRKEKTHGDGRAEGKSQHSRTNGGIVKREARDYAGAQTLSRLLQFMPTVSIF